MFKYSLIMAAGRGSRMIPLTNDIPKAMAPYANTTLIGSGISYLNKKIPNIYVTVGYKGAILAKHVISQGISGLFDTSGHDNCWWIFNTLMSNLDEPVLVLTCDNIVLLDIQEVYNNYVYHGSPPCMLVPAKPLPGVEGDYIKSDIATNKVKSFLLIVVILAERDTSVAATFDPSFETVDGVPGPKLLTALTLK